MTERQILKTIGKNVKAARERANLTQECLAELVGVHWQTINYLERGKYPFSVATFAQLTQALDISANRLLDGLPEPDMKRMARIKKAKVRKRRPKGSAQIQPQPEPAQKRKKPKTRKRRSKQNVRSPIRKR